MNIEEKNLAKLQRLLNLMDDDALTKQMFLKHFKEVVDFVKKIEAKNIKDFEEKSNKLQTELGNIKNTTSQDFASLKQNIKDLTNGQISVMGKSLKDKLFELDVRISQIKDGRDGFDADEKRIIKSVLKQIKFPELPKQDAEEMREFLNLEIENINGLEERLEKFGQKRLGGGGGFSKIAMEGKLVDDESPSGIVNGVTTAFTIVRAPNPTGSLKVFVNGMRMRVTEDYTLSGTTITFGTAPPTGSILLVDYRI